MWGKNRELNHLSNSLYEEMVKQRSSWIDTYVRRRTDEERRNVNVHDHLQNIKIYTPTRALKDQYRYAKHYLSRCLPNTVFVWQTKQSINTRIIEYKTSCELGDSVKSASRKFKFKYDTRNSQDQSNMGTNLERHENAIPYKRDHVHQYRKCLQKVLCNEEC